MALINCQILRRVLFVPQQSLQSRSLFYWINLQFNALDQSRLKKFGPDRTCAEWILRNGGAVKLANFSETLHDYNYLPEEGDKVRIQEVDASKSSIMHNGFDHFRGCNHIEKVILHKCNYLENRALEKLSFLENSLLHLQVSSCFNISEKGLTSLSVLKKLKDLWMFELPYVKDKPKLVAALQSSLPHCKITFD